MKAVNVDDVLKILHKYGKYIFVTDMKKYFSMVDEIANLKPLPQETVTEFADRCKECGKMHRCKDCRFFEYDSATHGICSKWCAGCTTSEDGYCFLFEQKEGSNPDECKTESKKV